MSRLVESCTRLQRLHLGLEHDVDDGRLSVKFQQQLGPHLMALGQVLTQQSTLQSLSLYGMETLGPFFGDFIGTVRPSWDMLEALTLNANAMRIESDGKVGTTATVATLRTVSQVCRRLCKLELTLDLDVGLHCDGLDHALSMLAHGCPHLSSLRLDVGALDHVEHALVVLAALESAALVRAQCSMGVYM